MVAFQGYGGGGEKKRHSSVNQKKSFFLRSPTRCQFHQHFKSNFCNFCADMLAPQNSTNLKCKLKKAVCKTVAWKSCAQNVGEINSIPKFKRRSNAQKTSTHQKIKKHQRIFSPQEEVWVVESKSAFFRLSLLSLTIKWTNNNGK